MTAPLSTGGERRVATMVSANREAYRISSSASGGSIWARNRRKDERRKASYRGWLDEVFALAYSHRQWPNGVNGTQFRDLIVALRKVKP